MSLNVPSDFQSDGCTMPAWLSWLLGGKRYRPFCREHDFLRRHDVVHWLEANWILAYRLWQHGLIGKLRAPLYFLATTVTYPFYSKTEALPTRWDGHALHYEQGRWK